MAGIDRNTTQTLSAILTDARQGVGCAAAQIHQEFVDSLVRLASRRINNRFRSKISPEEIVQSVFASFFRRNNNEDYILDDWDDLWALLVKITLNKCVNQVARFDAAKRDVRRELTGHGTTDSHSFFGCGCQPTAQDIAIFNESLDELLDRIPQSSKEIVNLRLKGMSNFEISESLGCSERTVYRALKKIRKVFNDLENS